MQTGIATAIFLTAVVLTLCLYYLRFIKKEDSVEFVEKHSTLVTLTLATVIFFGTLLLGVKVALLLLAFGILFFMLLVGS
jgi:hypothetical protein